MECPFLTRDKGDSNMASADRQICFKMNTELADSLGHLANRLDINMSKMVRACLLLGMPVFEKNPMLLNVIDTINNYKRIQTNNGDEIV